MTTNPATPIPAYRVTFQRVGARGGPPPPPFDTTASCPAELAENIYRHIRPMLGSRHVFVDVDLEDNRGAIYSGVRTAGTFTIERLDADHA